MSCRIGRFGDTMVIKTDGVVTATDRFSVLSLLTSLDFKYSRLIVDHSSAKLDTTPEEAAAFGRTLGRIGAKRPTYIIPPRGQKFFIEVSIAVAKIYSDAEFIIISDLDCLEKQLQQNIANAATLCAIEQLGRRPGATQTTHP